VTGGAAVYPFVVDLVLRRATETSIVLEVGCGAMQYAPLLPGRYYGLDLPTSDHVRERPHFGGSAEELPLDDESVDVVFGVATFYYMAAMDRVFAECHRVLRPGGHLLVVDYQPHVIRRLVEGGDTAVRHVWDVAEVKRRLREAGFARRHIHDLSHRAGEGRDPRLVARPFRLLKRHLLPHRRHFLVVEARKGQARRRLWP
jgi:SAM-dependent methyltransferase